MLCHSRTINFLFDSVRNVSVEQQPSFFRGRSRLLLNADHVAHHRLASWAGSGPIAFLHTLTFLDTVDYIDLVYFCYDFLYFPTVHGMDRRR